MYIYRVAVKRVIDGDTVVVDIDLGFNTWIKNEHIRIYGIDAPEIRTKDLFEKAHGMLATERLKELLSGVGVLEFITTMHSLEYNPTGKFGRVLADLIGNNGVMVSQTLIAEGYAVPYNGESKDELIPLHSANRRRLVSEGKLTWVS